MQLTNAILYDFIYCPYKGYKKSKNQTGNVSDNQILYNQLKQVQKANFEKTFSDTLKPIPSAATFDIAMLKEVGIRGNLNFKNTIIDLILDGIEFTGTKNITPLFITPFEKVTITDKLFVALQAHFIHTEFNIPIENCKVIFGKNIRQTKFKLSSFTKAIKKVIGDLNRTLSNDNAPAFFKNRHCQICEFQNSCIEKLVERDDLSLLSGLKPKEILQRNNKGIFSVKQLSYTFRPKKNPYRKKKIPPRIKSIGNSGRQNFYSANTKY